MGGRGSSGARTGGGAISGNPRTFSVDFTSRSFGNSSRASVLSASADSNGNVTFTRATPLNAPRMNHNGKTQKIQCSERAGAVNGKLFGINLKNTNSVTFPRLGSKTEGSLKQVLKNNGFEYYKTTKNGTVFTKKKGKR